MTTDTPDIFDDADFNKSRRASIVTSGFLLAASTLNVEASEIGIFGVHVEVTTGGFLLVAFAICILSFYRFVVFLHNTPDTDFSDAQKRWMVKSASRKGLGIARRREMDEKGEQPRRKFYLRVTSVFLPGEEEEGEAGFMSDAIRVNYSSMYVDKRGSGSNSYSGESDGRVIIQKSEEISIRVWATLYGIFMTTRAVDRYFPCILFLLGQASFVAKASSLSSVHLNG